MTLKANPDQELITGLRKGDSATIQAIYAGYAPRVKQWVIANSGSSEEAKDVFQDGLQAMFEAINQPNFQLHSSFEGLFFTICKRNWYGVLRKKSKWQNIRQDPELTPDSVDLDIESVIIRMEEDASQAKRMSSAFSLLSELCQNLLKLYAQGDPPEKIAVVLKMSGRNAVYQRRKACADRWKTLLKQNV